MEREDSVSEAIARQARSAALEEAAKVIEAVLAGELPIPNPKRLEFGPYCAAAIRARKEAEHGE